MDENQLRSSTLELAVTLMEKRGTFSPFCRAITEDNEPFIYSSDLSGCSSVEQSRKVEDVVRLNVTGDIYARRLKAVAFCFDGWVRFVGDTEQTPVIRIEMHSREASSSLWHFIYRRDGNIVKVLHFYREDIHESIFSSVRQIRT